MTTPLNAEVSGLAKYRSLIVLATSFFGLVAVLSGVTFVTSQQIASATKELEIASQQTVLVQQMSKNMLDLNLYLDEVAFHSTNQAGEHSHTPTASATAHNHANHNHSHDALLPEGLYPVDALPQTAIYQLAELSKQSQTFTEVLNALKQGGTVKDASGREVNIRAVTDPALQKTLGEIETVWTPFLGLLEHFDAGVKQGVIKKQTSDYLVDYARLYNLSLQAQTIDFSSRHNDIIQHVTSQIRMLQIGGVVVALLLFLAMVFGSLRQLTHADKELAIAQRQTTNIMNTVNEGLFLINKDFVISDTYSKNLETILVRDNIAGNTLFELLHNVISHDDIEATKLFIEQLYNSWVVSDLIEDLNPLKQVKLAMLDDNDNPIIKYLSFSFLRVHDTDDEAIDEIFVSVVDITKAVLLEQSLAKEKAQHDRQIEMIGHILNVDTATLNAFIANTYERVEEMNDILKSDAQIHAKAQSLFRKMHSLKGEASAIGMASFVSLAEQGEDKLTILRKQNNVSGQDFLGLTVILDGILDLTQFVETLINRLRTVAQSATTTHVQSTTDWERYFGDYAEQIAERQGKDVSMNFTGFEEANLGEKASKLCQDVGIQLLKNAIVHGIETPEERLAVGKSSVGKITMMFSTVGSKHRLSILDDGAGINLDKIRQKALELDMMTHEEADNATSEQLYSMIFSSGFSTANEVDEDAGRGVGMDIVREWVEGMNGDIKVDSVAGLHTKITVDFDAV